MVSNKISFERALEMEEQYFKSMRFHSLYLQEQQRQKSLAEPKEAELVPLIEEADEDEVTAERGKEGSDEEDDLKASEESSKL